MIHTITISGMTCDHCVRRVRKALATVPDITVKDVQLGRAVIEDAGDPAIEGVAIRAIADAGYVAEVAR